MSTISVTADDHKYAVTSWQASNSIAVDKDYVDAI